LAPAAAWPEAEARLLTGRAMRENPPCSAARSYGLLPILLRSTTLPLHQLTKVNILPPAALDALLWQRTAENKQGGRFCSVLKEALLCNGNGAAGDSSWLLKLISVYTCSHASSHCCQIEFAMQLFAALRPRSVCHFRSLSEM